MANPPDYGFTSSAPETAAPPTSQGNGLAVAGLVLGIISLPAAVLSLFDIPIAILGIIFGGVGLAKAKRIGGRGKGMAAAGLICGVIGLILAVALFIWAMGEMKREMRHRGFDGSIELPVASQPVLFALADDPGIHAIG